MTTYHVTMVSISLLLLICSASSLPVELIERSDHGLADQRTPLAVSPAMLTFFKGTHTTVELPEAIDSATIARASHVTPPETRVESVSGSERRKGNSAVVAGVISGVVCLVAVVGAAVGLLVYKRRNGPVADESDRDSKVLSLVHWNRGSEVRLGSSGP
jgi:hypothetical protein